MITLVWGSRPRKRTLVPLDAHLNPSHVNTFGQSVEEPNDYATQRLVDFVWQHPTAQRDFSNGRRL